MKSLPTVQTSYIKKLISGVIAANLSVLLVASGYPTVHASDAPTAPQWNVMVVPSREAVYSGQARKTFNKNCASCHSKDGRAQTPIARQRHVQDLSMSMLPDDIIVEQILEGTHNKANTFKMPPFKEKLTRAEVESLVPLVKAFRPVSPVQEHHVAATPRLVGLINLSHDQYAVLETAGSSNRHFLLRKNESHEGVTLLKLEPKTGTLKLNVGGTNPIVTLTLDGWAASHPRGKGITGFLDRLGKALAEAPSKVVVSRANTDVVLFLYSQFTGRTLLRSPRLPAAHFDLEVLTTSPETAAHRLNRALAARGITIIEDGDRFLLVVPTIEAATVKPRSSEIKLLGSDNRRPELFPGGVFINFANTDLSQVIKFYADLTGRELDPTQHLPLLNGAVNFTTQTALSNDECAYALETLLAWHGLRVVPVGSNAFKFDGVADAGR